MWCWHRKQRTTSLRWAGAPSWSRPQVFALNSGLLVQWIWSRNCIMMFRYRAPVIPTPFGTNTRKTTPCLSKKMTNIVFATDCSLCTTFGLLSPFLVDIHSRFLHRLSGSQQWNHASSPQMTCLTSPNLPSILKVALQLRTRHCCCAAVRKCGIQDAVNFAH